MTTYPFEAPLFVDAVTFTRAPNAQITIYDELDLASTTPLVLTDPNGLPMANPLTASPDAFGPNFRAPSPRVKWSGGGLTGFLSSPTAVLDEAKAARVAAEAAAELAQAPTDAQVDAGITRADIPGKVAAVVPGIVDPVVTAKVPPLVASALASDPSVANSAATLAQSAAGLVPAWKANTAYGAGQRIIAPSGDVVSAKAAFTSGASFDPTKWNASTQDGRIGTVETRVNDIGLATNEDAPVVYGITDKDGRRLWIEAGADGGPTSQSVKKIAAAPGLADALGPTIGFGPLDPSASDLAFSMVDSTGRRLELELGADGRVTDRVLAAWASRMGSTGGSSQPMYPIDKFAAWGDSLTGDSWPGKLQVLLGMEVYGGGVGGQKSFQIAARQGGVPTRLTVAGDTIPASGTVAVTAIKNRLLSNGASLADNRPGRIGGVHGTLTSDAAGNYTFTRTTSGQAVPIPAWSYFAPEDGAIRRDWHTIIWSGRNSFAVEPLDMIVAGIRSMIDYLSPAVRRVMVLEVPPSVGEEFGSAQRAAQLDPGNAAIKAAFPEYWVPIATWLRTPAAATAAGIAFTADDNTDIANGLTPRSFRRDTLHFNDAGNVAIAYRVKLEAQNRGWIN